MNQYHLVFEEHFDIDGAPNPSLWTHEVGEKWANNELQCYVDDRMHSYVKDSKLHIIATHHSDENCLFRSARINTMNKKHFTYGKFVVRAKMPKGRGSWPAIWFLGTSRNEGVRWPLCGEIDLLEYAGNRMDKVSCAIHTKSYNHRINTQKGKRISHPTASDAFHDYGLEWTPEFLSFSIDGNEYFRVDKHPNDSVEEWPFDQPYYLIINLAVGGWYGGNVVIEDLPYHLEVDYIKVYQMT